MKTIRESRNAAKWPRKRYKNLELRKKDFAIRITDWMRDKDEPAYDVEVYIGGVYDFNESKVFPLSSGRTKEQCKVDAIAFAHVQTLKLL